MMICRSCGHENADGAMHCARCEDPLGARAEPRLAGESGKRPAALPPPQRAQELPGDSAVVRGTVSSLQTRTESFGSGVQNHIWSFRVDCYDEQGNITRRYPVEIRAHSLSGSLRDGDMVEVSTTRRNGELLTPNTIVNLTTAAETGSVVPRSHRIARYVAVAAFLGVFVFVAWSAVENLFFGRQIRGKVEGNIRAAEQSAKCFDQETDVKHLRVRIEFEKDVARRGSSSANQDLAYLQQQLDRADAALRECRSR